MEKALNPNGGAIALGHPLGASGARAMTAVVHHLRAHGHPVRACRRCARAAVRPTPPSSNASRLRLLASAVTHQAIGAPSATYRRLRRRGRWRPPRSAAAEPRHALHHPELVGVRVAGGAVATEGDPGPSGEQTGPDQARRRR